MNALYVYRNVVGIHRRRLIWFIFPANEKPPSAKSHVTEAKIEDKLQLDLGLD